MPSGAEAADRIDPSRDPLGALAAAAGYDDPERWWDDVVESRLRRLLAVPAADRGDGRAARGQPARPSADERRREAYMRQTIRAALQAGPRADRGGLRRLARAGADLAAAAGQPPTRRSCAGCPRRKVDADLGAVDHERLASAERLRRRGRPRPGWYHHLFTAPDQTDRALADQGRPGAARAGPAGLQRARHRGGPAGRDPGQPARPAAGRADRGHRGDPGGAVRRRRAGGPLRHRAPGGRPGPGLGRTSGCRPCRWRPT